MISLQIAQIAILFFLSHTKQSSKHQIITCTISEPDGIIYNISKPGDLKRTGMRSLVMWCQWSHTCSFYHLVILCNVVCFKHQNHQTYRDPLPNKRCTSMWTPPTSTLPTGTLQPWGHHEPLSSMYEGIKVRRDKSLLGNFGVKQKKNTMFSML